MEPLARTIDRVRNALRSTALTEAAAKSIATAVGGFGLLMLADWAAEFPRLTRAGLLAALAALLGWLITRLLALLLTQPDDDTIALRIEKAQPELRTRLISSVQLARAAAHRGGPNGLVAALVRETTDFLAQSGTAHVVDRKPALRALRIALMISAGVALAFLLTLDTSIPLARRALLQEIPIPRQTRILEVTGDTLAARRDDLALTVRVGGRIPRRGRIVIRGYDGRRQELPLEADPADPARFQHTVARLQDPFTYTLRLGDATAGPFTVTTCPRPSVQSVGFEQDFPAYTGLPPVRRLPGDLHLLAGSRLRVSATASTPLASAGALLAGSETDLPFEIDPDDPTRIRGIIDIPAQGLNGFTLRLTDRDGLTSKGSAFHPIDILPDHPPAVRLTRPERREELVTPTGTVPLAFEAADDFGIARVTLVYKRPDKDPVTVELDLAGPPQRELRGRFDWQIARLTPPPTEGETVEFWIRTEDANTATGPGTTESEHQILRIVSLSEKRAELLDRMGDTLEGLQEIAAEQERITENLGTLIFARPDASSGKPSNPTPATP